MLKKYSVEDWKQDVKKIMQKVSVAEKHCVFMLSDNQVRMLILMQVNLTYSCQKFDMKVKCTKERFLDIASIL